VTEPTGPDTLAVLELGGLEVTARLRPDTRLKPGDLGRFAVDLAKMVWFDPASGARIG
jgi:multiple sugar transport system ATP-binding protein